MLQWIKRYRWWIVGVLVALIAASAAYGLTQLSLQKEHERFALLQQQYAQVVQQNQTLSSQFSSQSQTVQTLLQRLDTQQQSNSNREASRSVVTVQTKYDPTTGKIIEQLTNTIGELSRENHTTSSETHSNISATNTVVTSASGTVVAVASSTTITSASSTTTVSERDKVTVKPSDGGKNRDMRVTIGATVQNDKVKPSVGYTVRAFGVGKIVSIGPGIVVGQDLAGAEIEADILDLPRIGAGVGCDFGMRNCGPIATVGIRLDF